VPRREVGVHDMGADEPAAAAHKDSHGARL
jgi:hypothetical protein